MGLFKNKGPRLCPVCNAEIQDGKDWQHFTKHVVSENGRYTWTCPCGHTPAGSWSGEDAELKAAAGLEMHIKGGHSGPF